jgi:high affinity Mn2+ porin
VFGGSGIGHGFGVAGFPNGDLNRVSTSSARFYLARAFVRQTIELGGAREKIDPDQNQIGKTVDVSRITFTAGKLSAADIFDANTYAHDPRTQFMNWALVDNGAWDYPSDIRGYTYGGAVELNEPNWALRYGIFMEPSVASGAHLDYHIGRAFSQTAEYEQRYALSDHPGKLRLLGFFNRALMGDYEQAANTPPHDITLSRRYSTKFGFGINLEQQITNDVGVFARLSWNDGRREEWAFAEIDRHASLGISVKGTPWKRPDDTFGLAGIINGLSRDHRRYLESGGVGFMIGDGRLTYRPEEIIETYYSAKLMQYVYVSTDLQFVNHPAYNRDRGPVLVAGLRLHLQL